MSPVTACYQICGQFSVLILLNSQQQSTWSTFLFWVLWTTGSLFSSFHTDCSFSIFNFLFVVVQLLTGVWLFVTPWNAVCQASLSFTISQSLLKLISIESMMPSNRLILSHPLHLLPSNFPSIRVFMNRSALCIKWPKYWSFSNIISPSNEDSGLITFRIDWLDLLAVQGTLKSLLQHHRWKASILQCSDFFTIQLSHPYMTTGKINHSFD